VGEKRSQATITVSWWIWIGVAIVALLLYLVRAILPPFLVGIVLAYVLGPAVTGLQQRWRLPRPLAVLFLYALLLGPLILAVVFVGPRFFEESRQLVARSPLIIEQVIAKTFGPGPFDLLGTRTYPHQIAMDLIESLRDSLGTPTTALHVASALAEFALGAFLALVVSVYLLLDSERLVRHLFQLIPAPRRTEVEAVSAAIHRTLARYLRGQLYLVGVVAVVSFLGLEFLFHLHYALPLAVATGLLEIIPFVGPVVAAAIAGTIALAQGGPGLALGVIIFYTAVRQIEDQIVMPFVVGHAVELHPLIVIFSVLAGGALFGVLGTLLAVPVAAAIKVILEAWLPFLLPGHETAEHSRAVNVGQPVD
jgi:predicted PurR-regulated permease PerM